MPCFKCSRNASADYNSESTASISFISETATVKGAALFNTQNTVGPHQPEPFIGGKDVNTQGGGGAAAHRMLTDRVSLKEALQKRAGYGFLQTYPHENPNMVSMEASLPIYSLGLRERPLQGIVSPEIAN